MNPFLLRRLRGPIYLLCFAVTAILNQWHILPFYDSWPLYLITAALLSLGEALLTGLAPTAGYPPGVLPRRRSLTGGVFLLVIGVVALLVTTGALPGWTFWGLYGTWWPLLLVVLGVLLLLERLLDRSFYAQRVPAGSGYPPYYGYRRRGGGITGLVVLLVLLGLSAHHGHWNFDNDNWNWSPDWNWNFGGPTFTNDVALDQAIAPNGTLLVSNARGDVQIAPSADGRLHVEAHQTAHVSEHAKQHAFDVTKPQVTGGGSALTLTVPGQRDVSVRLELQVPAGVQCTVHTSHGDVAVAGLEQALEITDDHGDVTLDNLGGAAHLAMDHGDIRARSVHGDLAVDGRADDIDLSEVGGKVLLNGEFFGDTQLSSIGGAVAFHSSRTTLDMGRLTGSLTLDSDDLHIAGVSDGLRVSTRSKDIEVDGLAGPGSINDSNGDMEVAAAEPLGTLTLNDTSGNITLSVPSNAAFRLDGTTGSDDTVESAWGLVQTTQGDTKTLQGSVGTGGPEIVLRTEHGDLTLRKATTDATEATGAHAAAPQAPEHERHLHANAAPAAPVTQ